MPNLSICKPLPLNAANSSGLKIKALAYAVYTKFAPCEFL